MKSLMRLMQCALADAEAWCCASTTRDFNTISRRFEHEGPSFLTIALPQFCADFERSLSTGCVDSSAFMGFQKRGALPTLFGGLLELVFDRDSGWLLGVPNHTAIFFIRQLTLMWKKINLPCSSERVEAAYDKYIKCESEVQEWSEQVKDELLARFDSVVDLVWNSDLCFLDRKVFEGEIVPRHGPGATADRLRGNQKYDQQSWTQRLEEYFPSIDYLVPNSGFYDRLDAVDFREPEAEMPVRVITVPKTLKTPRIIAVEPTCMQYAQQALMELIVSRLEQSNVLFGSIGFTDQTPNQRMACAGSWTGRLATLDLSEASDRVSNLLVKRLFRHAPSLLGALQACRSSRADVPGYGVISLSKFASMGSAVCFPVEAMVFLTVVLVGISDELSRNLTKADLAIYLPQVRIYGDDIIVPVEFARSVACALEVFGLKVNTRKSFWTGKFRESCGKDYYDGSDVTVTYVRRMLPGSRSDVSEIISGFALRNQLYEAGLWRSTEYVDTILSGFAPTPVVAKTSPVLGRYSYLGHQPEKECPRLHRPLVKGYMVRPRAPLSPISGEGALLKFFLKRGREPIHDAKHLERYGRPRSVDIKIGWGPAV